MKLTDRVAQDLTIPEGKSEVLRFDDDLPNFGLRVRAGGKRTWICQYRTGQKQRRVTIGTVAAKTAGEARKDARRLLAMVQLGQDPQTEKFTARAKASVTLGSVVKTYLAEHGARRLRARTLVGVKHSLEKHWAPLSEAPLDALTRAAISKRLDEIATVNGPVAANRARAYLSGLYGWAVERGLADDNPVRLTGRSTAETSRDRVLSDQELALVYLHAGNGDYGAVTRLLLLTGQRRQEVGGMLWSEIDFDRGLWSISANRTKNGLRHDVPLSGLALSILEGVARRPGRDLVFGLGLGGFSGWSRAKVSLDDRIATAVSGEDGPRRALRSWRIHDLRRTAVTRMADLGVLPHVVEAVVNHLSGTKAGVAGVYNRSVYSNEKAEALQRWAGHVKSLLVNPDLRG